MAALYTILLRPQVIRCYPSIMTEEAVRRLIVSRSEALQALDAAGFLANYVDDAVIIDLAPPLVHGLDPEGVSTWMRTWDGPIANEIRLLMVNAAGAIAHAAGLERLAGSQGGYARDLWFRFTLCFARISVGWRITHEHTSLPVRKLGGELIAATDLLP
jgi:ketosteroid isomerase-like protein